MGFFMKVFRFVICSFVIYGSLDDKFTEISATPSLQEKTNNVGKKGNYFLIFDEELSDEERVEAKSKIKSQDNQEYHGPVDDEDSEKESSGSGEQADINSREDSVDEYMQSDEGFNDGQVQNDAPNSDTGQGNSSAKTNTSSSSPIEKQNATKAPVISTRVVKTETPTGNQSSVNATSMTVAPSTLANNGSTVKSSRATVVGGNTTATPQTTQPTKAEHTTGDLRTTERPSVHSSVLLTTRSRAATVLSSASASVGPTGITTVQSNTIATTTRKNGDVENQKDTVPTEKQKKTLFGFVTIEILVALLAGAACTIILLVFLVHRLKKRNEGSYELQESLSLKAYDEKEVFV